MHGDGVGHPFRIVGADVVTLDPDVGTLHAHDVHVGVDGRIEAITPSATTEPTIEDIDGRGMVLAPGFVDVHRHLWVTTFRGVSSDETAQGYRQFTKSVIAPLVTPEDVYAATLWGCLEALAAGITTVVDYAHIMKAPEYADASVEALTASGARAVLAHAPPNGSDNSGWWSGSTRRHPDDIARVHEQLTAGNDLVSVMMGARGLHFLAPGTLEQDVDFARELGVRVMFEGIGAAIGPAGRWNESSHRTALRLAETDRLGPDLVFVHGNQLPDAELELIGSTGGHLAVAPLTEMLCGYGTPALGRALRAGIRPGLAVDIVTSVGGDMFAVMRVALAVHRGLQADSAYRSGTPLDGWDLTTRDLLDLATSAGARLIGREHEIGSIRPGHFADLVLLRAQDVNLAPMDDAVASLVLHAHPGNVDTVLVAGRVVKRDGRLVGAPLDEARRLVRESRDRLRRASGTSADVVADEIWRF